MFYEGGYGKGRGIAVSVRRFIAETTSKPDYRIPLQLNLLFILLND